MEQVTTQPNALPKNFNWGDYFSFRKMMALQMIQIVYIVVAVIITLAGLMAMFKGNDSYSRSFMPTGFFGGLLIIVIGNVMWRLWCEFFIVLFRINASLNKIDDNTRR